MQGDAIAQVNLALLFYDGEVAPQNFHLASYWFRAAAEAGQPKAQGMLSVMFFLGQGVPQDFHEAARWAALAAEAGLPEAQSNLGYFCERGWGVPLDYVAAFAWYSKASSAGGHVAAQRLVSLRQIMTPKQIRQASDLLQTPSLLHPPVDLLVSQPARRKATSLLQTALFSNTFLDEPPSPGSSYSGVLSRFSFSPVAP